MRCRLIKDLNGAIYINYYLVGKRPSHLDQNADDNSMFTRAQSDGVTLLAINLL